MRLTWSDHYQRYVGMLINWICCLPQNISRAALSDERTHNNPSAEDVEEFKVNNIRFCNYFLKTFFVLVSQISHKVCLASAPVQGQGPGDP